VTRTIAALNFFGGVLVGYLAVQMTPALGLALVTATLVTSAAWLRWAGRG